MAKKFTMPYGQREYDEVHKVFARIYKDGAYYVSESMCRRWYGRLGAKPADNLKGRWDSWVSDRKGRGRLVGPRARTIARQKRKSRGKPLHAFIPWRQPKLLIGPLKRPSGFVLPAHFFLASYAVLGREHVVLADI